MLYYRSGQAQGCTRSGWPLSNSCENKSGTAELTPGDDDENTNKRHPSLLWSCRSRASSSCTTTVATTPFTFHDYSTSIPPLHRHVGSLAASYFPRVRLGHRGSATFRVTWRMHACSWQHAGIGRLALSLGHSHLSAVDRRPSMPPGPQPTSGIALSTTPVHGTRSITRICSQPRDGVR